MNYRNIIISKQLFNKYCIYIAVLSIALSHIGCSRSGDTYSPAADFEECETIYVGWDVRFPDKTKDLVILLSQFEHITVVLEDGKSNIDSAKELLKKEGCNIKNIEFLPLTQKYLSIWVRDYAPVFLFNEKGHEKLLLANKTNELKLMSKKFFLKHKLKFKDDNIFESVGGAREFNGKGTVILVEDYEMFSNMLLDKKQIELFYNKAFNQSNIIWLKNGLPVDEERKFINGQDSVEFIGTGGHVDEFCRFVNDSTIVLAEVDSSSIKDDDFLLKTHQRLEENFQVLKESKLQDGRKLNIKRVPLAPMILNIMGKDNGTKKIRCLVTSYLNFIITDKTVVLPSYDNYVNNLEHTTLSDERTANVFKELVPNHNIVFCDPFALNNFGGGFHCVSFNKIKKRKVNS